MPAKLGPAAQVLVRGTGCLPDATPREYARFAVRQAVGLIAHAFNHCDNPELPGPRFFMSALYACALARAIGI